MSGAHSRPFPSSQSSRDKHSPLDEFDKKLYLSIKTIKCECIYNLPPNLESLYLRFKKISINNKIIEDCDDYSNLFTNLPPNIKHSSIIKLDTYKNIDTGLDEDEDELSDYYF